MSISTMAGPPGVLTTKSHTGSCCKHIVAESATWWMTPYKIQNLLHEWVDFSKFSLQKILWFCSKFDPKSGQLVNEWVTFSCKYFYSESLVAKNFAKFVAKLPNVCAHLFCLTLM